jgi:hypothetical protein
MWVMVGEKIRPHEDDAALLCRSEFIREEAGSGDGLAASEIPLSRMNPAPRRRRSFAL